MTKKIYIDRFMAKVQIDGNGCWIWNGAKTGFRYQGSSTTPRRSAWLLFKGELGSKFYLDTTCGNTSCVNPDHLIQTTKGVPGRDIKTRLLSMVEKDHNGCWLFTGCRHVTGYGMLLHKGQSYKAHRLSYELFNGEIPEGLYVCHHCDVRACVNPDHLFVGTAKDNLDDMYQKNRQVVLAGPANGRAKLSADDVREIRNLCREGKKSQRQIGELYGMKQCSISEIVRRVTYRDVK